MLKVVVSVKVECDSVAMVINVFPYGYDKAT
jgi:hypothetical protein